MYRLTLPVSILACTALLATAACQADDPVEPEAGDDQTSETTEENTDNGTAENGAEEDGEGPPDVDVSDVEGATLHTSEGDIELALHADVAPMTVANFVGLAEGEGVPNPETGEAEFYNDTVFHRVISEFMIQGGDPEGSGRGGPGYQFEDELDDDYTFEEPGVLAMANSGPGTNGSQFVVTLEPTPLLNGEHTIFGQVADEDSLDVVDAIGAVETDAGDRPNSDIVLETVTIERADD